MTIKKIIIQNVRGIERIEIDSEILKNRPNILVAPNGFGKTSIATAFRCAANQTSIKVNLEDRHKHDDTKKAKIELKLEENKSPSEFAVTEEAYSNTIQKKFDIHIVSDLSRIKAHSHKIRNYSIAKAKIVIDPIVICEKPRRESSPYKKSEIEQIFKSHKKALPNIKTTLFQSNDFIMRSPECWQYINALVKPRKWNQIEKVRKQFSEYNGSTADASKNAITVVNELFHELQEAKELLSIIKETTSLRNHRELDVFLAIWQILSITKNYGDSLKNYLEWLRYSKVKKSLQDGLNDFSNSWKTPSLKEIRKIPIQKDRKNLIVEMPDPNDISNGQRDVLLLISLLHIARYNLKKSKAILIIDEVFDYLDDANLIVAQYYISQLIADYKRQGRSIYTMILTHLDPAFFKNYVFSKQKIIYLSNRTSHGLIPAMKKLISARDQATPENKKLQKDISNYLLHYHTEYYDFSQSLKEGIPGTISSWGVNGIFQEFLKNEFDKYSKDKLYDPLAICAITRRSIEELAFKQICEEDNSSDFFAEHNTTSKLRWAAQREATIPEAHYLLRIIFNDGLHWRDDCDNIIPIVAKLSHPIIKKMIMEVVHNLKASPSSG